MIDSLEECDSISEDVKKEKRVGESGSSQREKEREKENKSCHKDKKGEDLYFLNLSSHHVVWYIYAYIYTYIHLYTYIYNNMNGREGMDSIEIITDSCD